MRAAIVERARAGDHAAFTELVSMDGDRCYAVAYRILRDPERAKDAVQQTYLLAWRELGHLRDVDRYEVWLHRLLVNACYMEGRRQRRWSTRVQALGFVELIGVDEMRAIDDRDALERALAVLSPSHRAVFVLHHHAGFPLPVVAEIVGAPVGTVKSRLHYATKALRGALAAESLRPGQEVQGA